MKKSLVLLISIGLLSLSNQASAERSGEQVYKSICMSCHMPGVAGAPKPGDATAWNARYDGDLEQLLAGAKRGKNVMPPKGSCGNCTDDELRAAINFMRK